MATKWRFSVSLLGLALLLLRATRPGLALINVNVPPVLVAHSSAVSAHFLCPQSLCSWKPVCTAGPRKLHLQALVNYWLLLLAGDVERNPGPVKHPCGICSRPVKCNQKGIQCDCCYYWLHTKCLKMRDDEYMALAQSDESWCCPACLKEALPFHDCSAISLDLGPDPPAETPQPVHNSTSCNFCSIYYSNCRSLLPKLDQLRAQALSSNPGIIALVETWLDSSISNQEIFIPGYSFTYGTTLTSCPLPHTPLRSSCLLTCFLGKGQYSLAFTIGLLLQLIPLLSWTLLWLTFPLLS